LQLSSPFSTESDSVFDYTVHPFLPPLEQAQTAQNFLTPSNLKLDCQLL